MDSVLSTYEDEKFNTSNVILCPAELSNCPTFYKNS